MDSPLWFWWFVLQLYSSYIYTVYMNVDMNVRHASCRVTRIPFSVTFRSTDDQLPCTIPQRPTSQVRATCFQIPVAYKHCICHMSRHREDQSARANSLTSLSFAIDTFRGGSKLTTISQSAKHACVALHCMSQPDNVGQFYLLRSVHVHVLWN